MDNAEYYQEKKISVPEYATLNCEEFARIPSIPISAGAQFIAHRIENQADVLIIWYGGLFISGEQKPFLDFIHDYLQNKSVNTIIFDLREAGSHTFMSRYGGQKGETYNWTYLRNHIVPILAIANDQQSRNVAIFLIYPENEMRDMMEMMIRGYENNENLPQAVSSIGRGIEQGRNFALAYSADRKIYPEHIEYTRYWRYSSLPKTLLISYYPGGGIPPILQLLDKTIQREPHIRRIIIFLPIREYFNYAAIQALKSWRRNTGLDLKILGGTYWKEHEYDHKLDKLLQLSRIFYRAFDPATIFKLPKNACDALLNDRMDVDKKLRSLDYRVVHHIKHSRFTVVGKEIRESISGRIIHKIL